MSTIILEGFYGVAQHHEPYGVAYIVVVTVVVDRVVVDSSVVAESRVCSSVVVEESEVHERMVVPLPTVKSTRSSVKTMVTSSGAYYKYGFLLVNLS